MAYTNAILGGAAALMLASTAIAADERPMMRDFIGINGHTVQFDPKLYAPLTRLARDFHPVVWDMHDKPGTLTQFPMAQHIDWKDKSGKFRSWHEPINWKTIYGSWQAEGFDVNACLQIDGVEFEAWPNVEKDMYVYGKAFASYFGPSNAKLVTSAEIGNEPAHKKYTPERYKLVLRNMARGLREGDPKLTVVTCAVQFGPGDGFCLPIETLRGESDHYDVINLHEYAFLKGWPSFERSFPEDERIQFLPKIKSAIEWRDANAPGKPIWLTEFGFDATTQQPAANNKEWKSSTDLQQAQWIVRSFLTVASLDVDRAYLYFFNDDDAPSFHASSGVTRHMTPKPSYWAMKQLQESLGAYRFTKEVTQTKDAHVFEFAHEKDARKLVWVAWSPTGTGRESTTPVTLPGRVVRAEMMALADGAAAAIKIEPGATSLPISESPSYFWIEK